MKLRIFPLLSFISILAITNCTDLEEKYGSNLTESQVAEDKRRIDKLLNNLDKALMEAFQNPSNVITLSEIPTDELIAPTRGIDWYDNGLWQQLDEHRWDADHVLISNCFNDLSGVVFAATDILKFKPTVEQEARARFYRALAMYWQFDFFDQVPYRDSVESTLSQARVRKGMKAFDYIISEINNVMPNLSDDGQVTRPSKDAARVLLMKCYLNKNIYSNRKFPALPQKSDMDEVIKLADDVLGSGRYQFSENYFDNFAPNNGSISTENILTQQNVGGGAYSGLAEYIYIPLHYKNTTGGYNGWATLPQFYDTFEAEDLRRGQVYRTPSSPPNPGNRINVGFLEGQQYGLYNDTLLYDRKGRLLIFTRDVKVLETGPDLETTGIRPQKYVFDWDYYYPIDNDWVYFRLPDVLLMKAEAILQGGTPTSGPYGSTALELVNSIRQDPSRGASKLSSLDLQTLLDERGRELWLECWRRQDLIRFGKFLKPFENNENESNPRCVLFPIPNQQLTLNENLTKNEGY